MAAPSVVRPLEFAPVARPPSGPAGIPFRIRIGVTGGHALIVSKALADSVLKVLDEHVPTLFDDKSQQQLAAARHTPLQFTLVTSLAEGAEQFVVQAVGGRADVRLEVVLPFSEDEYRREFSSEAARAAFDVLVAAAQRPIRLRDGLPSGASSALDDAKAEAYAELGSYVVDHCDVVLALGVHSSADDRARSAALLEYARYKGRPIVTISATEPSRVSVERGHGFSARSITRLEMLNAWPVPAEQLARYVANVERETFGGPDGEAIPPQVRAVVREHLIPQYARASTIAKWHQRRYFRAGLAVYVLSSMAVALVALGTLVHAFAPVAFGLELVLLTTALVIVRRAHQERTHAKWVESRFLAERLRHGIFLAACGVEATRLRIPSYMGGADQTDDWMVRAFDEIWSRLPALQGCRGQACAPLAKFVASAWVAEQRAFHEKKATREAQMSRRLERTGAVVLLLAIGSALGHLLLIVGASGAPVVEGTLTFGAIVLPAAGAAIGGFRAHREYVRLARRSRNMAVALRELEDRFKRVRGAVGLEALLRTTEDWMLRETQDWLMLMRTTKLEAVG